MCKNVFESAAHEYGHYLVAKEYGRKIHSITIVSKDHGLASSLKWYKKNIDHSKVEEVIRSFAVGFAGAYAEDQDTTCIQSEVRNAFINNDPFWNADTGSCLDAFSDHMSVILDDDDRNIIKTGDKTIQGGIEMETKTMQVSPQAAQRVIEVLNYCIKEGTKRAIRIVNDNKEELDRFAARVSKMRFKKLVMKPAQIKLLAR